MYHSQYDVACSIVANGLYNWRIRIFYPFLSAIIIYDNDILFCKAKIVVFKHHSFALNGDNNSQNLLHNFIIFMCQTPFREKQCSFTDFHIIIYCVILSQTKVFLLWDKFFLIWDTFNLLFLHFAPWKFNNLT